MFRIGLLSFLRDLWQTKTRFLSIFAIVAIGVGFFAGVRAAEPDMRESVNAYYVDHNLTHFTLTSPFGFDLDDLTEIENQLEQKMHNDADITVVGGYTQDVTVEDPKMGEIAARVSSYNRIYNRLDLVEGRLPSTAGECAVLADNMKSSFVVGDTITLPESAYLPEKTLTVTAIVNSPMYMSKQQYGTTNIGNGSISAVLFVTDSSFPKMYYNQAYIYDKYLSERVSYTDRFDTAYERLEEAVISLCDDRCAYYTDTDKNDYSDLHLDVFSTTLQENAEKLADSYSTLMDQQKEIADDAAFLAEVQQYFDEHDASLIPDEYSYPAYFAALLRRTAYDSNGLPIADYTCEGLHNLVFKEGYTADTYMYYKYQRYLLGLINGAQKEAYNEALGKYNEAMSTFRTAYSEVIDQFDTVWYYTGRDSLPAYTEYGSNAERIGNIAKVFPVFFLLVAALVCLTTMTRMVDENRTQIGIWKALGYSDATILMRYLGYALLASSLGSVVGVLVGFELFPRVIIGVYSMLYIMPPILTPFRTALALSSILITLLCIAVTVIVSCGRELFHTPANLLRPKAPQKGKRILLERIGLLWKRLPFSHKVTLRNLFRYKKRMIMTVIGIAGCTALILTAFGLKDSISDIVRLQFDEVMQYDLSAQFSDSTKAETDIRSTMEESDYLMVMQKTGTAQTEEGNMEVVLFVPETPERLSEFVRLRSRTDQTAYELIDGGIILSEKLASKLGVSAGGSIDLYLTEDNIQTFYVDAVTENYAYHYAYIPPALYHDTLGPVDYNTALCKTGDADQDTVAKQMLDGGNVLSVTNQNEVKNNFSDILKMLDSVILVLILSAGALAFVVLFNLSNINITERRREIATLKVLGYTDMQSGSYIFRENIILSALGTLVGLLFGRVLTGFVVEIAEIDLVMFGRTVYNDSYIMAAVITMVFAVVISALMHYKVKKIDMVESLKSVE